MGLFDSLKKAMTEPVGEKKDAAPASEIKEHKAAEPNETVRVTTTINLTEKMVKVTVTNRENDGEFFKGGYVWVEDDLIQVKQGDRVLFEVTPRSKAYKELEPLARKKLLYVVIEERQGDYGKYYRAKLKFEAARDEISEE